MKIKNQDSGKVVGIHRFSLCDIRNPKALKIQEEIEHVLKVLTDPKARHEILQELYQALRDVSLTKDLLIENIIPTAGRSVLALWIIGDNTYDADAGVNYTSLGDDNTTPANGDTTLGNETYRKAIASVASANNVAYLSAFYNATEVTGTIEEAGLHIDGTASADTGQLFSHFLTGTITKSSTETLTVESTITFS